jgi:SAM-dependent methyltransferase
LRDSKDRFSDRVDDYVKFRPSYPAEIVEELRNECGLDGAIVADIGSGPGNLARLLLPYAGFVYGIEPNPEMRAAGERQLADAAKFKSVAGSAEETLLDESSVDLVTAGQAYHWFDPERSHREMARILRPGGHAALIWNTRLNDATQFLTGYEALLNALSPEYLATRHRDTPITQMEALFEPAPMIVKSFEYSQELDWEGLKGRAQSSSYVPTTGEAGLKFLEELHTLFEAQQVEGTVSFLYKSEIHYGPVSR